MKRKQILASFKEARRVEERDGFHELGWQVAWLTLAGAALEEDCGVGLHWGHLLRFTVVEWLSREQSDEHINMVERAMGVRPNIFMRERRAGSANTLEGQLSSIATIVGGIYVAHTALSLTPKEQQAVRGFIGTVDRMVADEAFMPLLLDWQERAPHVRKWMISTVRAGTDILKEQYGHENTVLRH